MNKNTIALCLAWLIIMLPIVQAQELQGPSITDNTPPAITNVQLAHGPTTLVTWTTDEPANSRIEFGNTTSLGQNATKPDFETAHSLTLQTTQGTTYYYRITSCDNSANCRSTTIDSFVAGPFYVSADIPRYPRTTRLDIPGSTRPGAEVTVLLNGVEARRATIDDGTFNFKGIELQKANNTIMLKATLGAESAEATYQADVDNQAPIMNVTIAPVVTSATATAKIKVSEPVNMTIEGGAQPKNMTLQAGTTDVALNLQPGENLLNFTARDRAGFTTLAQERINYDTGPPRFASSNLRQLAGFPIYKQEIEVKGQLSEPGSVTVFVNGKPQKTEPTTADGSFSIKVTLERAVNYTTQQTRAALETNIGWKNKVRLEAVDAAGLKASTDEVEIQYSLCGSGTWIDVQLTEPLPDILNPRLLIEGIQPIGIGFNYTYRGGGKANINPREIRIIKLLLAPEFQKDYDNGLVHTYTPPVRAQRGTKPSGVGYIQINFQPIPDPWSLPETTEKNATTPANATMYDKELRVSQHREGTCLAPGFGCMRLFLELEIPFQEVTRKLAYDPRIKQTVEEEVVEPLIQRTCVNIEVAIDKRIPPSYIPSSLLRTVSNILGTVIEGIDKILKPIQTIGQYLFYSCIAGTFLSYVPIFLEKYNCQYKKIETALGGGAFNEQVAEIGACEQEYAGDDQSLENCNACMKWKDYRRKYERTYRQICDRVMCPAAPSLQYYLKTRGRQKPAEVNAKNAFQQLQNYAVGGKLLAGSDCAAWVRKNQKDKQLQAEDEAKRRGERARRMPPSKFFTTAEIEKIYQDWTKHKDDAPSEEQTGEINCAGLHPATPDCCGYEYMQEWSSACGTSAFGSGLDTFDEIKESTCLSAQKANKNEIFGIDGEPVQCNRLLNSIGGFCDKKGGPAPQTVQVIQFQGAPGDQPTGKLRDLGLGAAKERYMYLLMVPKPEESKEYDLKLGYLVESVEFDRTNTSRKVLDEQRHFVSAKLEGVELPESHDMQERFFAQEDIDRYYQGLEPREGYTKFGNYLCEMAGYTVVGRCNVNPKGVYDQVMAVLGTPDQEYIVQPNRGLINSVRCLCFPTIIGYLKLWSRILGSVRSCVNTILFTGDGEAGVCQAVVSKYVCDLLYDVLACFTQKFSTGQGRVGVGPGGDIMGALVAAGSDMSRSVESRYGESGMYKAVFVDRKLVHSVCMFAFTGTWNFDLAAVFDQAIDEVPLESVALMTPCNRRFVAPNFATRPGGLVTWIYHFGTFFAAGADAEVELHLKCSGGYRCRESDGFEGGKCDCDAPRDTVIIAEKLPTRIKKNQIISEEIFYTMAASAGPAQIRYDQAYILYRWKDGNKVSEGKTEPCTIGLTGGAGSVPAICRFDPFTQAFRCQFGEAGGALRFLKATPAYTHKIPTEVYTIGENVNITLQIQQDYQQGEANNKHLQFEVLSPAGQILPEATNKDRGLFLLATNGDYTKTIGTDMTYPIVVKQNWFGAPESGKKFIAKQWSTRNEKIISENTMIEEIKLIRPDGLESEESRQFVLEMTNRAGAMKYTVYTSTKFTGPADPVLGFGGKIPIPGCENKDVVKDIVCIPAPPLRQSPPFQGTLRIRITDNRPADGETIQSHIDYNLPKGADPCSGPIEKRPIVPLKMRFTAYDSDKYGQPTDQVSVDPITGADALIEVPFNAICVQQDDPALKALEEKAKGIIPATEIATGLKKLLVEGLIKKETDLLNTLKKDADPLQDKTPESVIFNLQRIIQEEQAAADALAPYLSGLTASTEPLKQLHQPADVIQEAIGTPPASEEELVTMAGYISPLKYMQIAANEAIAEINALPLPKDNRKVSEAAAKVLPVLQDIITAKKALVDKIETLTGVKIDCLYDKTDAQGNYYVCAEAAPAAPFEQTPTGQNCPASTQKCYKLPADNLCAGLKADSNFQCADQCPEGTAAVTEWQKAGTTLQLFCLGGKTCCRQAITGLDKLKQLKTILGNMQAQQQTDINALQARKYPTDDTKVLQLLEPQGEQAQIVQLIKDIIATTTGQQTQLQQTLGQYTVQERASVPPEVELLLSGETTLQLVIDRLEGIKRELVEFAQPTADDIRAKIDEATLFVSLMQPLTRDATIAINTALGIKTCEQGYAGTRATGCFDSCLGDWQQVLNRECTDGQSCCTAAPKILAAGTELLTSTERIFNRGEAIEFTFRQPVLQQTDLTSPQVTIAGKTIQPENVQTTFADNFVQNKVTQTIAITGSAEIKYTLAGSTASYSQLFGAACEKSGELPRFICRATPCQTGEKETATRSCPKMQQQVTNPDGSTKNVLTAQKCCGAAIVVAPARIDVPVQLASSCPTGYTPNYIFNDDNEDWAIPAGSTSMLAEGQWLQLCISNELIKRYGGKTPVKMRADGCESGWESKGWIKNKFDGWACLGTKCENAYTPLHLCVLTQAETDAKGEFAYIGTQKEGASTEGLGCKTGFGFNGIFQFKVGTFLANWPAYYAYSKIAYAGQNWQEFDSYRIGSVPSDNWIGLCTRPIEFQPIA